MRGKYPPTGKSSLKGKSPLKDKNPLKSKTLWFNVLALVIVVASALGFGEFEADPKLVEYGAVLITVVNLVLRFITKEPLSALKR